MGETDQEFPIVQALRTRRNIVKMGAILGSAIIASCNRDDGPPHGNDGSPHGNSGSSHQCFLQGTEIRTADGECKVEDLAIGDRLPTMFGGMRPIQWIGRYPFKKNDPSKRWVRSALPVRIARSALGPNVPHSDLYVSQGHALLIDGALVLAKSLINGMTIMLYEAREWSELEFFHIKLESHDVIYAEGAPCETLLTVTENSVNFADYYRRFGATQSEGQPCAPILSCGGRRSDIMSRARSAMSPWFDLRRQNDIIRDRLEERALALGLGLEAVS
jgi:hypothetical protein